MIQCPRIGQKSQKNKEVKNSIVKYPHERFLDSHRVDLPTSDPVGWVRVILVLTSFRLLVLKDGHLQVETDVANLAHAYVDGNRVYFTLKAESENLKIAVRSDSSEKIQSQMVSTAEKRLGRKRAGDKFVAVVPVFVSALVEAQAEKQSRDVVGGDS